MHEHPAHSGITPISLSRASSVLADRLRDLILTGEFESGAMLPSERDIVADSGLSRGSVREALRILETEGLVEMRTGRAGGALVTTPTRASLARSLEVFLRANEVKLKVLLDCRLAIEPMMARLAAESHSADDLAMILQAHEDFLANSGDPEQYRPANFRWHLAVAHASQNEPLIALMESVREPILRSEGYNRLSTPSRRSGTIVAHTAVVDAIVARDGDRAARAMEAHLATFRDIIAGTVRS